MTRLHLAVRVAVVISKKTSSRVRSARCDLVHVDAGARPARGPASGAASAGRSSVQVRRRARRTPSSPATRIATASAASSGVARTRSVAPPRSSATVDSRSSRPPLITPTRSQISCTSASRWLDSSTVWPPRASDDDQRAHVGHAGRVEPVGRLVEHDQLRVAQQRRRDAEPLLHAERVALELVVARSARSTRSSARSTSASARPAVAGQHAQVVAPGQVGVEARALDQGADPLGHLGAAGGPAQDARRAGGRPDQAEHHPQRGGLAGPVGAEEAVHLAAPHGHADAVDGEPVAVPLGQPVGLRPRVRSWLHARRRRRLGASAGERHPATQDLRTRALPQAYDAGAAAGLASSS